MKNRILALLGLLLLLAVPANAWNFRRVYTITTGAATDTTCWQCADSSAVLDVTGCDDLALSIRTDAPCTMALQIKILGDSLTTALPFTGSSSTDSTHMVVWPWRSGVISASTSVDSLSFMSSVVLSAATLVGANELKVTFPLGSTAAAGQYSYNYGYWLPLVSASGYPLKCERLQVRWRVLGNLSSGAPVIKTKISLHGYGMQ